MKTWLLLTGNRWAVAGLQLGAALAVMLAVGAVAAPGLESLVAEDPVQTLFQALVAGIITGVTLVLAVNQLVLSQELGSLGDQRDRLEGAMDYREDADDYTGPGASPAVPAGFLVELVESVGERERSIVRAVEGNGDGGSPDDGKVAEYGDRVAERAAAVAGRLEGRSFGDFGMLWAALHYDYSRQIQDGRSLLRDPDRDLPAEVREELEAVVQGLVLFGSAREHFKTLYFQRDLIDLSRGMLALALPALLAAVLVLLYFDPAAFPGETLRIPGSVWIVSLAIAVAVAPFVLLLSYILRIATVTRRTLAAGPFVLHPDQGRGGSL